MKMMQEQISISINQLVFFLMFQKYMRDAFVVIYAITLIRIFFHNTSEAFVKSLVLSMPF